MDECEQGSKFYFCAINSLGRIKTGDTVLIDRNCEIAPGSIVLTDPNYKLSKLESVPKERVIGKVAYAYIK